MSSRLEEELRNALRREQPPAGFAERVVARAEERRPWRISEWFRLPGFRWVVAGAFAMVMVVAGVEYRQERAERARAEKVKAQLMLALHITGAKLQLAQQRVHQLQGPAVQERERQQ